jgi:hypothetical protein
MRTAVTVATRHDETKSILVFGPEVTIDEQVRALKKLAGKTNPEFSRLEYFTSDGGRQKKFTFTKPVATVPPALPVGVDEPIATDVAPAADPTSDPRPPSSASTPRRRNR